MRNRNLVVMLVAVATVSLSACSSGINFEEMAPAVRHDSSTVETAKTATGEKKTVASSTTKSPTEARLEYEIAKLRAEVEKVRAEAQKCSWWDYCSGGYGTGVIPTGRSAGSRDGVVNAPPPCPRILPPGVVC